MSMIDPKGSREAPQAMALIREHRSQKQAMALIGKHRSQKGLGLAVVLPLQRCSPAVSAASVRMEQIPKASENDNAR